jgi:hypothetical protein
MTSLETHLRAIEQTADRGATVAFFDLDRTLIAGYSILALAIATITGWSSAHPRP